MILERRHRILAGLLICGMIIFGVFLWARQPLRQQNLAKPATETVKAQFGSLESNLNNRQPTQQPTDVAESQSRALEVNYQKWQAQSISHYQFSIDLECLCTIEIVTIEVNNGNAVSIIDPTGTQIPVSGDPGAFGEGIDSLTSYTTIDKMFSSARTAISQGVDFSAEYDARLGYPTSMCFVSCNTDGTDPVYIDVTNFKELP